MKSCCLCHDLGGFYDCLITCKSMMSGFLFLGSVKLSVGFATVSGPWGLNYTAWAYEETLTLSL